MKRQTKPHKPRVLRTPTEAQLAGLRASTSARKQATVERLQRAIETLKAQKRAITVQAIYEACGLRYVAIHRNPDALALFRANSTHLVAEKKRARRTSSISSQEASPLRDPLLNYKKTQLVARLREAHHQLQEGQSQQAILVETCVKREARIAELEAKLAELEPYRTFVEQVRTRMHQGERGRFGDLPPSI